MECNAWGGAQATHPGHRRPLAQSPLKVKSKAGKSAPTQLFKNMCCNMNLRLVRELCPSNRGVRFAGGFGLERGS